MLYQLLTGQPPFAGGTTYETIKLLEDTEPRPPRLLNPKIDRDLSTICLKCLEKDPERRYSSALALAGDLECWLKHEPIQARRTGMFSRGKKWVRRHPTGAVLAACLVALAAATGWIAWKSELIRPAVVTTGIAVLPFENLSEQREDAAAFVDGVQDDILTKLARIADLRVISRTSVMQYRGKQNVREIGDALRVSHVLGGIVRRSAGKVHINAQLVDARTDTHIWAEQYSRDLNDVFAIESEVAQSIASRLRAKVSAREKAAMQEWPTRDLVAYDLYTRANDIWENGTFTDMPRAIDLLNQAVTRDPSFLQAYCKLAFAHDALYWWEYDPSPARLAMAEAAVQEAVRIRPNAGEAHYARAVHLYRGYRDFDGALAELKLARQTLPNHAPIFAMMGYIQRRQGRWEESTRNLERAVELDPRDIETLQQIAFNYRLLNRYGEAKSWLARALAVSGPEAQRSGLHEVNVGLKLELLWLEVDEKADTRPLHEAIASIPAIWTPNPAAVRAVANDWLNCALAERDTAAATEALSVVDDKDILRGGDHIYFPRPFAEGLIARMTNDEHKAQLAFAAARTEQEKIVQAQPDYPFPLCVLGVIDAALGRKEEALREGRRALELLPAEKDAVDGKLLVKYFAIMAAWVGEKDLACERLALVTRPPGSAVSYGALKLNPLWDPLRGEPCFEKIVASLAPKEH